MTSASEFRQKLASFSDGLRRRIEAEVTGFATDPVARAARLHKVKHKRDGFRFFAETYFPHYLTSEPNLLHLHLFEALPQVVFREDGSKGARDVKIAARGSAKSTLVTQIFTLYCAALKLRSYVVIGMDVYDQAAIMLSAVKVELEENPRLMEDFPELCGRGHLWREDSIIIKTGTKVDAIGARQKVRGRRHGPKRPDLIILDDIENDENVRSPEYREKLYAWVMKAVVKAGAPDGSTDIIVVGSLLRRDAVLGRIAKTPGWSVQSFPALVQFPDRMDLWDQWEEEYLNAGEVAADAFYKQRRAAMDEGAVLNWPAMQSLLFLMKERAESPNAFASEYQNDPISENAPFQALKFWVARRPEWLFFGAVDPSLGKSAKGRDPSAIIVGGYDRTTGVLNIVEASIKKRLPDVICEDIIAMQREFNCVLWFVEAVQFQEFLRTELMVRAAKAGVPLAAIPIIPITDKRLRIERLQPPTASGLILFKPAMTTLLDQLRHWPDGEHDDGPDCLEMLWTNALKHGGGALSADRLITGRSAVNSTMAGYRL